MITAIWDLEKLPYFAWLKCTKSACEKFLILMAEHFLKSAILRACKEKATTPLGWQRLIRVIMKSSWMQKKMTVENSIRNRTLSRIWRLQTKMVALPLVKITSFVLCQLSRNWATEFWVPVKTRHNEWQTDFNNELTASTNKYGG